MFRIRRIHDDVLPANKAALGDVKKIWRERFSYMPPATIENLSDELRNPLAYGLRTVVLVAEQLGHVRGFAILMHAPDLSFCFLDYISTATATEGRGFGAALYQRARDEALLLGATGLFFECLPDEESEVSNPSYLKDNRARLKFYERLGARPIANNDYNTPIKPGDLDMPYLMFDDLGTGQPLGLEKLKGIVGAILERKYRRLCSPEYNAKVIESFVDDPARLRAPKYGGGKRAKRAHDAGKTAVPRSSGVSARSIDLKMLLLVSKEHEIHHIRERGYVEAPVRVAAIEREVSRLEFVEPLKVRRFGREHLARVHDPEFLRYLEHACAKVPEGKSVYPSVFPVRNQTRPPVDWEVRAGYYCIDTFTPITRNAWPAARAAVDCALTGASVLLEGARLAYALLRPPGHHAERRVFGGFCYLNSAAAAAEFLSRHGSVAMVDVDFHHGNGQQDIFYERSDVLTASLHAEPNFAYPYFTGFADERGSGDGLGFNVNVPLPEKLTPERYLAEVDRLLAQVRDFRARFLVVCIGYDTARGDPTGSWLLGPAHFEALGSALGALSLPTLVVQEGGYLTRTLGTNAKHFSRGLWEATSGIPGARRW